jgi:hypothetical protein
MNKDSISVSEKHGVNPSVMLCPVCGKGTGVALFGKLPGDKEAPRNSRDMNPCEECQKQITEWKKLGFVIFVIDDEFESAQHLEERKRPTPWQMFKWLNVIKKEAAEQMFNNKMDTSKGAAFMTESLARSCGLKPDMDKGEASVPR